MLAGLALQGCDCTQVGCDDQLRVEVRDAAGAPVAEFSGEAIVEGRSYPFRCVPGNVQEPSAYAYCSPSGGVTLHFETFPERVELRIEGASGGRFTRTLEPDPERVAPNGERCGPVCEQASFSVELG